MASDLLLSFRAFAGKEKSLRPAKNPNDVSSLGQKPENFCGATQIDEKSPALRRAITRLSRITEEKPVGTYWGKRPFSPPSAVHSAEMLSPPSHRRRLSSENTAPAYSSASQVSFLIAHSLPDAFRVCQAKIFISALCCNKLMNFLRSDERKT